MRHHPRVLCKHESFIPRKASGVDVVIVLISQKGRLRHGAVRSVVQAFAALVSLAPAPGSIPSLCSSLLAQREIIFIPTLQMGKSRLRAKSGSLSGSRGQDSNPDLLTSDHSGAGPSPVRGAPSLPLPTPVPCSLLPHLRQLMRLGAQWVTRERRGGPGKVPLLSGYGVASPLCCGSVPCLPCSLPKGESGRGSRGWRNLGLGGQGWSLLAEDMGLKLGSWRKEHPGLLSPHI